MILVAHVGRRSDNGNIAEALLYEKGYAPTVRVMTSDNVRVMSDDAFEIELEGARRQDDRFIEESLTKVIAALVGAGLTREQREALKINTPNFTVR